MYGAGLRLMEAVSLRVKDIDISTRSITVLSGKGAKDRIIFPWGCHSSGMTVMLQRVT
jgi:site-specific recombinase XerD